MTLVDADEVAEWVQFQDPNFTSSDVPAVVIKMVEAQVKSRLRQWGFVPEDEITDPLDYSLWGAGLCYALEMLAFRGQVQLFTGDVTSTRLGRSEVQFQKWQPMFFFATGVTEKFYDLLPHETYRMLATQFLRAWLMQKTHNWSYIQSGRTREDGYIEMMVGDKEEVPEFLDTYYEMVRSLVSEVAQGS